MATKQLFFYATDVDLKEIIERVEAVNDIRYYKVGLLDKNEFRSFSSLGSENVGIADYSDNNLCTSYLVTSKNSPLEIRNVPQRDGGEKIAIDQLRNPASLYFKPAGIFEKEQAIIEGKIGTVSDHEYSKELFNKFSKELKSKFKKNKGYWVGSQAAEFYNKGWRLTQNVDAPKEYDLSI